MTKMDGEDERALVERLRAGDAAAFDVLYERYRARIFAFLLRLSRNRTLAEDLLDEVWVRLVTHAPRLRDDTNLPSWLFSVARNLYWSARRTAVAHTAAESWLWPEPQGWPSPFELAAAGELERSIERALAALPPKHREVLLLVGIEGLAPAEAANICGISAEALRQRLSRARAALSERLVRS
ncbi:MAG: RNA polymerase sigma factor [Vicinamibacterales bacterium]